MMKKTWIVVVISFSTVAAMAGSIQQPNQEGMLHTAIKYSPLQKEQTYCSSYEETRYKVLINKNKIRITRLYKEYKEVFTGTLSKGKIYSNDPNEKKSKETAGKYYKLQGKYFGVLNSENGDYDWFTLCPM